MSVIFNKTDEAVLKTRNSYSTISMLQERINRLFEAQGYVPKKIRVTQSFMAELNDTSLQCLPESGCMFFHHSYGVAKLVWDARAEPLWSTLD